MKIKNVEIKSPLFLAPMAGVTDRPFRTLCRELGAGLTFTEMVSVKGLYYNSKNTLELLKTSQIEHPCAVQLFGHEPEIFEKVLKSGVLDKFDIIDINMGCPAPKIVKNGDGSALLKDFELAKKIITTCVNSTDKPVTIKFRKGFEKGDDFLIEFAKLCEQCGASAITVHPRTRNDFFSGEIDIEDIRKVKNALSIPVIGNGDVVDRCTYEHMLKSGCDAVMIGRGAVGNPEIFLELQGKKNDFSKLDIIKRHIELMKMDYDDKTAVKLFKRHILAYLSGFKNSAKVKKEIVFIDDFDEMQNKIFEFFSSL